MDRFIVSKFDIGDVVRVSPIAFPGSDEPCDIAARGQVGIIIDIMDDDLYFWQGLDGTETSPITTELEYALCLPAPTIN